MKLFYLNICPEQPCQSSNMTLYTLCLTMQLQGTRIFFFFWQKSCTGTEHCFKALHMILNGFFFFSSLRTSKFSIAFAAPEATVLSMYSRCLVLPLCD